MNDDEAARSKTGHYIQYARLKKRLAVSPQVLGNNRCQTLGKFSNNLSPRVFEVLLPHLRRQSCGSSSLSCCRNKSTCMWLFGQFFSLPDRVSYSKGCRGSHMSLCIDYVFRFPSQLPMSTLVSTSPFEASRDPCGRLWHEVHRGRTRETAGERDKPITKGGTSIQLNRSMTAKNKMR